MTNVEALKKINNVADLAKRIFAISSWADIKAHNLDYTQEVLPIEDKKRIATIAWLLSLDTTVDFSQIQFLGGSNE